MSIDEELEKIMQIRKAEKYLVLSIFKPNKKYSVYKLQKLLAKKDIKWMRQRVARVCNSLCDEQQLQKIYKRKKGFYIKPFDKSCQV